MTFIKDGKADATVDLVYRMCTPISVRPWGIEGPTYPFVLRYLSRNSFIGPVNSMSYGKLRSHRKKAKQLEWTFGCFLPNALPRECGAYFAQHERVWFGRNDDQGQDMNKEKRMLT
jgi:hypothetical protein